MLPNNNKKTLTHVTKLLEESEDRYKLLVESVRDYAVFMLDPTGIIISWNIGAERTKGYKAEEIIGKHFSIFYTKRAVEERFPQFELIQAIKEGSFEDEGWRVKKDGSTFWANVVITPMYKDGKHIGFSKVTRDMTQKIKNEELMKKNKALLRINTDLDNFIYTASHDLKSPIANLEGLITLLNQNLGQKVTPVEKKVLQLMDTSILRLKKTITDLTDITKIQKGLQENLEVVSFDETMKEVKSDIEKMIIEAHAEIHERFQVKELVYTKAGLKSILYNLLSNAIKYRSPKRPLIIDITSYTTEDHIVLSVKDNGLGLRKGQRAKLFTMFKRFHDHVEGTGIGLYIIKRIVQNNGGWIEVKSELDKGSEFTVYLAEL